MQPYELKTLKTFHTRDVKWSDRDRYHATECVLVRDTTVINVASLTYVQPGYTMRCGKKLNGDEWTDSIPGESYVSVHIAGGNTFYMFNEDFEEAFMMKPPKIAPENREDS